MFAINSHSTWVLLQRDICACWQPIRLICICEKAWILRREWLRVWPIHFILGMDLKSSWFHLKHVWMEEERGEKGGRDPSLICHIPGASWPNTQSTRLGFTGMDYPAGLTFSQLGNPAQITLPLHVSVSPSVREVITLPSFPQLTGNPSVTANYLQLRDQNPWLTAERGHCAGLLPKLRQFIRKKKQPLKKCIQVLSGFQL